MVEALEELQQAKLQTFYFSLRIQTTMLNKLALNKVCIAI